jgi:hypothetical protein
VACRLSQVTEGDLTPQPITTKPSKGHPKLTISAGLADHTWSCEEIAALMDWAGIRLRLVRFLKREPKYPPAMVEEAKHHPNGWVYEIVGSFDSDDAVPPEAIKGAWRVGPDGKLTGEYEANANFRPAN